MPPQTAMMKERNRRLQDIFGLLDRRCFFLFIVDDPVEETGWWELFRVADDHQLSASGDGAQGILRLHLRRLVHDNEVEVDLAGCEILRNRHRPHHEARLQGHQCIAGAVNQLSERNVLGLFRALALE